MTKPTRLTRRRFLSVCAMAGTVSALPWAHAFSAAHRLHHWKGILLGAEVSLSLVHPDAQRARRIFAHIVKDIQRLERIFTLYDKRSELSRLNKDGYSAHASPEMIDILQQSKRFHDLTGGAFDITVKAIEDGGYKNLIGMRDIKIVDRSIRFEKQGLQITLNGIAQGYITDKITEQLKAMGLKNMLVQLGEKRSIGHHPAGRPWAIGLPGHDDVALLSDHALATSSTQNPATGAAHIINPKTGQYTGQYDEQQKTISVIAKTATMADALSTGFLNLSHPHIRRIQAKTPDIGRIYLN